MKSNAKDPRLQSVGHHMRLEQWMRCVEFNFYSTWPVITRAISEEHLVVPICSIVCLMRKFNSSTLILLIKQLEQF